jgi:Tfp pilus assembly protein PilN
MINLLPPIEKQRLASEEKWKMILILGIVILVFIISLILILISINFSVSTELNAQSIILNGRKKEMESTDLVKIEREITAANNALTQIDSFYKDKISMTDFLQKISSILPKGIFLNSFSVTPVGGGKNTFQVAFSGYGDSVDSVKELKERLNSEKEFSQVNFPNETWFQEKDFIFSVTFQAEIQ